MPDFKSLQHAGLIQLPLFRQNSCHRGTSLNIKLLIGDSGYLSEHRQYDQALKHLQHLYSKLNEHFRKSRITESHKVMEEMC